MLVYRIAHKKYAGNLGVSGLAGRWNSSGKMVLYTAENLSLALLENMVYRAGTGFNDDFKIMVIKIPDDAAEVLKTKSFPQNWRSVEAYPTLRKLGDLWYDDRKNLALRVPSALLPENFNIILNTTHSDFAKVKLLDVLPFVPDGRLEKILKKYKS